MPERGVDCVRGTMWRSELRLAHPVAPNARFLPIRIRGDRDPAPRIVEPLTDVRASP